MQDAVNAVCEHEEKVFNNNAKIYGVKFEDVKLIEGANHYACKNGMIFNRFGTEIKGGINRCGYRQVSILINGFYKTLSVHRLIMKTFKPMVDMDNLDVNHIDGNKTNNNISNLEWCTRSENVLHSFRSGLQDNVAGVKTYSLEEKEFIKNNLDMPTRKIANILGRTERTVRKYKKMYREGNNDTYK
ncbi:MAG: HNH endonuclease signature motif containing protein [Bacilli bacterium]